MIYRYSIEIAQMGLGYGVYADPNTARWSRISLLLTHPTMIRPADLGRLAVQQHHLFQLQLSAGFAGDRSLRHLDALAHRSPDARVHSSSPRVQ